MTNIALRSPLTMRRLMAAVAMAALVISSASAATLKTDVLVAADVVTVGDIFEDAGAHASYVLAPAPLPGKTLTLKTADLTRIANAFALDWRAQSHLEQSVIRRSGHVIGAAQIEAALIPELARKLGANVDVQISDRTMRLYVAQETASDVSFEDLRYDAAAHKFKVSVVVTGADQRIIRHAVTGQVHKKVSVPVLSSAFVAGEMISEADIDYIQMREADLPTGILLADKQLIGMTPRRTASFGKPLQAGDLEMPKLVQKGQIVTLTLSGGGLYLSLQGKALQNGAMGDVVRILNTSSNRIVEGIVDGPQSVALQAVLTEQKNG